MAKTASGNCSKRRANKQLGLARRDRLQADARLGTCWSDPEESRARRQGEFLEPVLKTIDPFLRLLFPGARLALDEETLEITGIARDGREEPYATLSIGTREQLSILVRLAFAVYLREKGYPAAVILDDALVYADDDRFERMQLALRKAAETVQISILTCRPRDWRQFGAPIRRLADATTAALELALVSKPPPPTPDRGFSAFSSRPPDVGPQRLASVFCKQHLVGNL